MTTFRVLSELHGRHPAPHLVDYPLLPGDLIVCNGATWTKVAPGLGIEGFILRDEDSIEIEHAPNAQWELI